MKVIICKYKVIVAEGDCLAVLVHTITDSNSHWWLYYSQVSNRVPQKLALCLAVTHSVISS